MSNSSWRGTMPNTASQVAELQTQVSALQTKHGFSNSVFFNSMIDRLQGLRDQIKKTEDMFYSQFNLTGGTSGLLTLQQRLDQANQDYGFRSMSNVADSDFDQLVKAAIDKVDLQTPITLTFNQVPESLEALVDTPINALLKDLESMRSLTVDLGNGTVKTSRMNKSSTGTRGFSKFVKEIGEVTIDPVSQKKRVTIILKEPMGQAWQKRLEKNYDLVLDTGITREEVIRKWLQQNISNSLLKSCVMYQFEQNKNKYDLNASAASIKGFLGEVRTNAFLDYLCGGPGTSRPLGNLKEIINGRMGGEIPIDVLFKGYGFQVKNYRVIDGQVNFQPHSNKMGMGNFILERLRPEEGLKQLLLEFYGSWAFNQPVEGSDEKYGKIYSRFESKNIEEFFEGHVDNILRVSDEFQANIEEFASLQLYYNTFFLVGDRFLPSSSILSAIIEQLRKAEKDRFIISSFNITPPSGGTPVWQEDEDSTNAPPSSLASRVKIEYSIVLKLDEILKTAYSNAFQF